MMPVDRATLERIIEGIADMSVQAVLKQHGVERMTFYKAVFADPTLYLLYESAQSAKAEAYVEELVDIADNELDPQVARNRIDARRWYASKMRPTRYGDQIKVQIEHTVDLSGALREARQRLPINTPRLLNDAPQDAEATASINLLDDPIFK